MMLQKLITGGAHGIGRALCRRFTAERVRAVVVAVIGLLSVVIGMATPLLADETAQVPSDQPGYAKTVAPFFKTYCTECHEGDKPEGEFAIDAQRLLIDFGDPGSRSKWREIVNVLNSHEMPPEKETQPTATEVAAVVDWITEQTVRAELILRERTVVMRRLNRSEYRNTIRDLIGVDFNTEGFPQDPPAGGFDNNGGATQTPRESPTTPASTQ